MTWVDRVRTLLLPAARGGDAATRADAADTWDRAIFDAVREPLLIVNSDGRIAAANRAASRAFVRSGEELTNSSLQDLFRSPTRELLGEIEAQTTSTSRAEVRTVARLGDGSTFDAVIHVVPIFREERAAMLIGM